MTTFLEQEIHSQPEVMAGCWSARPIACGRSSRSCRPSSTR